MSKHAVKLITTGTLVLLAGLASARAVVETPPLSDFHFGPPPSHHVPPPPPPGDCPTAQAPEIDPASLASAVTLLMGGLVVLRNRKT